MSFFAELKRRNVFRVGAAYLVLAWLLMQVTDTLVPALHLPAWIVTAVALFLIIGLPLALVFAWAFELTPEGLKREADVEPAESIRHQTGRKLDFLIIGALVLALGYFAYDKVLLGPQRDLALVESTKQAFQKEAAAAADAQKSIAVLPFANMSADPEQEFFADGISEEVLNTLAAIRELKVAGRTSSFQFKGTNKDLREIGKTLSVSTLLEGSVRKAGNRVRITAQLIEAESGFHLWSETFDREYSDVFAIQTEVAEAVGKALQIELGIAVKQSVTRRTTVNLEAYSLYLRAMQHRRSADVVSLRKGLELSAQVMAMDPEFLPGYVAYANSATALHSWGIELPDASLDDVERLMKEVLSRDAEFADAWAMLGTSHSLRFQWKQAEQSYARAAELAPNLHAVAEDWSYTLMALLGRPAEAAELLMRAIAVDPLGLNVRSLYADALGALGRQHEAEAAFRQILHLDPAYSTTYYRIAAHYSMRLGRPGDSIPWFRKAIELDPESPWYLVDLAQSLYDLGAHDDAKDAAAELAQFSDESHVATSYRYNLARLSGDEATAEDLKHDLAENIDRIVEGLHYFETLEWLRNLQAREPAYALRVYERIQPGLLDDPPEVGPWNHGVAVSLALLKHQMGDQAAAGELARAALNVTNTTTELYGYFGTPAVAWLVLGDEDRAILALDQTFRQKGARYFWSLLEIDPAYDALRARPEFQALIEHIRADMAEQLRTLKKWEASNSRDLVLDFSG